jgi:hypothetical protein
MLRSFSVERLYIDAPIALGMHAWMCDPQAAALDLEHTIDGSILQDARA